MKIIDAQVHIWGQTVTPPSGKHRKVSQVTAEDMLKEMDEAGVDAALIHPPTSWDPNSQAMALAISWRMMPPPENRCGTPGSAVLRMRPKLICSTAANT